LNGPSLKDGGELFLFEWKRPKDFLHLERLKLVRRVKRAPVRTLVPTSIASSPLLVESIQKARCQTKRRRMRRRVPCLCVVVLGSQFSSFATACSVGIRWKTGASVASMVPGILCERQPATASSTLRSMPYRFSHGRHRWTCSPTLGQSPFSLEKWDRGFFIRLFHPMVLHHLPFSVASFVNIATPFYYSKCSLEN
jgi:hypothetical protein